MEGAVNGLAQVGEVVTQFAAWMGNVVTTMTSDGNEIMLIPVGIFCFGAAIGLAKRLIGG